MEPVQISYYSDVLCIWAYIAQRRIEKLVQEFGDQIVIHEHYCSVFPDAWSKIGNKWDGDGGFSGFNRHLLEVAEGFPHIEVNERLWLDARPRTSASAHLFLKAVGSVERQSQAPDTVPFGERQATKAAWALRRAFFADARDISDWSVQCEIAEELNINADRVNEKIRSSEAFALLAADYDLAQKSGIEGSPTFIMNNGRQKLFGNVGYRLLQANVQELLHNPSDDAASWC